MFVFLTDETYPFFVSTCFEWEKVRGKQARLALKKLSVKSSRVNILNNYLAPTFVTLLSDFVVLLQNNKYK